jgi:thiamine pyrophosphate-dependent acetolactate synthase large subunit-like protein
MFRAVPFHFVRRDPFGLPAYNITRAEAFAPTLESALSAGQPSVIAAPVDYRENHRLTEAMGEVQISI